MEPNHLSKHFRYNSTTISNICIYYILYILYTYIMYMCIDCKAALFFNILCCIFYHIIFK